MVQVLFDGRSAAQWVQMSTPPLIGCSLGDAQQGASDADVVDVAGVSAALVDDVGGASFTLHRTRTSPPAAFSRTLRALAP